MNEDSNTHRLISVVIERHKGYYSGRVDVWRLGHVPFKAGGKGSLSKVKRSIREMLSDVYGMDSATANSLMEREYNTPDTIWVPVDPTTAKEKLQCYQQGGLTKNSLIAKNPKSHMWETWVLFATTYGFSLREVNDQDECGGDHDPDIESMRQSFEAGWHYRDLRDKP